MREWISHLPAVNASLNATCALLLVAGYSFIRRRQVERHRLCMVLAFLTSVAFLASYLTYHAFHGRTPFPGTGGVRLLYLAILTSHTILAVVILPMALVTLGLALLQRFEKHRRIARITLPLWLYVSVTGVVVYWMLYQMRWP